MSGRAVSRVGALLAVLPLAAIGTLLYFVPYQLPRLVVRLSRGTEDVVSTYKLGAGLLVYPLFTAAYIALGFLRLPLHWATALALTSLVSPFAALAWLDRSPRIFGTIRSLLARGARSPLLSRRERVMRALNAARARIDPSLS